MISLRILGDFDARLAMSLGESQPLSVVLSKASPDLGLVQCAPELVSWWTSSLRLPRSPLLNRRRVSNSFGVSRAIVASDDDHSVYSSSFYKVSAQYALGEGG